MYDRTIRYILTVAEEKSVSKAAKKLYISQPSLSCCIIKQEKKLGAPLFDRTKQPMELTYAGELYVQAAKKILDIQARLEKDISDIACTKKERIAIGVTKQRSTHLLPRIMPDYKNKFPSVDVSVVEEDGSMLEPLLLAGKVDIAILLMPVESLYLEFEHLYDEEILLCLHPDHWAVESFLSDGVDLSALQDEPFILFKPGKRVRKLSDVLFHEAGFFPKIVMESQMAETIFRFVSGGMGCAFLPKSIVNHISVSPMPVFFTIGTPPASSSFAFAWMKGVSVSRSAQEFMKITRKFLEEESQNNR